MCVNSEGSGETARLRRFAFKPSLFAYAINKFFIWAGSNEVYLVCIYVYILWKLMYLNFRVSEEDHTLSESAF